MRDVLADGSQEPHGWLGRTMSRVRVGWRAFLDSHAVPPLQPSVPAWQPCHSVRVLVVDDNPVNLMVISALMLPKGLVPLLASDGAEAVALACELHFDLILMDLQMPILDGLEATVAIRQFEAAHAKRAVPVLAYSTAPPSAALLASQGLNGSLGKPCDERELEDCLVRWCPAYRSVAARRGAPVGGDPGQAGRWGTGAPV